MRKLGWLYRALSGYMHHTDTAVLRGCHQFLLHGAHRRNQTLECDSAQMQS